MNLQAERGQAVVRRILSDKLIAIVRGVDKAKILDTVRALQRGGISLVEITFDQSDPQCERSWLEKARLIKLELGGSVILGAGTVLNAKQADTAAKGEADYIISPHADAALIRHAKQYGLISIPGAYTASEIVAAMQAGADFVKLFPCCVGGTAYVKAVKAPLSNARLLAVGGVDETNIKSFLEAGCVGAGLGGSLVSSAAINAGRFDEIEAAARRVAALVR